MTKWQQHRQILLALTFVSVFFTLGRFSLDRTAGNRQVTPFAFSEVVPLPKWQMLESHPLVEPIASPPKSLDSVLASRKYLYRRNNHQLEIKMRYIVGTSGHIPDYFNTHTSLKWKDSQLLQNFRQQEGVGFYSLFVYQGRSHLSACINPHGGSTVTSAQFLVNHHTYGLRLQRLIPWLLGKESLQDRRCVWAHLSTPLNQESAETTYPVLEQAWLSWYQWWRPRFPQH